MIRIPAAILHNRNCEKNSRDATVEDRGRGKKREREKEKERKKRERNAAKLRQILPQQHRVSRPNKIEGFTTRSADPDTPFVPPPPMPLPSPRIFHDSL